MNRYLYVLSFCLLIISCNQNPSQVEKDYIKNLREKNKILEKELQELKSNTEPEKDLQEATSIREQKHISQETTRNSENSKGYFTIGSTEDEVLDVMGDPTEIEDLGRFGKLFHYGYSGVSFTDGKVDSYDNSSKNLRVK